MAPDKSDISLGFTQKRFPPGIHICQIVTNDDERQESLLKFVLAGLSEGERTACFSEKIDASAIEAFLSSNGISYDDAIASGSFMLSGTREAYFQENRFDPERMLENIKNYYIESVAQGCTAARIIGEMTNDIQDIQGGGRLLEYESKVSQLLKTHPVTSVCQYDAREFSGSVLMDVLKVHPFMVVRGAVVNNPFHIPPEEYLAGKQV